MAQPFILSAQLRFKQKTNINQVIASVRQQLSSTAIDVPISVKLTGGTTSTDLDNLHGKLTKVNKVLAEIATNATTASTGMKQMAAAVNAGAKAADKNAKNAKKTNKAMKDVAVASRVAGQEMAYFGHQSALAVRRFLAFSIPAGIIVGLVVGIKRGVGAAVEFEREMIKVSQITGRVMRDLRGLQNTITNLSTTWGVSSNDLVKVAKTFAQTGMSARDVGIALEAVAKADLAPTFESMEKTTEGLIAVFRQFNKTAEDSEEVLSQWNAVAKSFAVESGDLVSAVRRAGGAFSAAGGELEELNALFTSVRATTRESADSIATGFRTIFTRIQRPRTIEMLRQLGVELQNNQQQFVGPYEAIRRLNAELSKLSPRDVRFSQIIEQLGGFRQVSKVIPLIQQFNLAQKAYYVQLASNRSLEEDAIKAKETLAQQIKMVREEWVAFLREFVASKAFQDTAKSLLNLARALARVADALAPLIGPLIALGVMRGVTSLAGFGGGFAKSLLYPPHAQKFQTGGAVPGSGAVPIIAHQGEYVVSKKAVKRYGQRVFENYNDLKIPSRQTGGPVAGGGPGVPMGTGGRLTGAALVLPILLLTTMKDMDTQLGRTTQEIVRFTATLYAFHIAMQVLTKGVYSIKALIGAGAAGLPINPAMRAFGRDFAQAWTGRGPATPTQMPWGVGYTGGAVTVALSRQQRWAAANRASMTATGFNLGQLGVMGAGAGLWYGGSRVNQFARTRAGRARGFRQVRGAERWRQAGGALQGAGAGLAVGGMIGSVVPVIGTAVGAAIGAGVGGLVGALTANTKEIRQLNRSAVFDEAAEAFSRGVDRLLEGTGGTAFVQANLQTQLAQLTRARAEGDVKGAKGFSDQLKASIPRLVDLKTKLVETTLDLDKFKNVGGETVVKALMETTGETRAAIEQQIERDIEVAKASRESAMAQSRVAEEAYTTSQALRFFTVSMEESGEQMKGLFAKVDRITGAVRGQARIPDFGGRPGFGRFAAVAEGRVRDVDQFRSAAQQLLGGIGGGTGNVIVDRMTESARLLNDLPDLLRAATADYTASSDSIVTALTRDLDETRYGTENINMVIGRLNEIMASRSGAGEATALREIRRNAEEWVSKEFGKLFKPMFDAMQEMADEYLRHNQELKETLQRRVKTELDVISATQNVYRRRLAGEQMLFEAMSSATNRPTRFPYARAMGAATQIRQTQVAGLVPTGQERNVAAIFKAFVESKNRLEDLNTTYQEMEVRGERTSQVLEDMANTTRDMNRLHKALEDLANSSEELSAIQAELGRLQEAREKKFDLLTAFTFGSPQDKRAILGDIGSTIVAAMRGSVRGMWPQQAAGALRMAQNFENVQASMFGLNRAGQTRTGREFLRDMNEDMIRAFSGMYGMNWATGMAQATRPGAEEQRVLQDLTQAVQTQDQAQQALRDVLQLGVNDLNQTLTEIHKKFATTLNEAFKKVLGAQTERQIGVVGTRLQSLKDMKKHSEDAADFVNSILELAQLDMAQVEKNGEGAVRFLESITKEAPRFTELTTLGKAKGAFTGVGLPEDFFQAIRTRVAGIDLTRGKAEGRRAINDAVISLLEYHPTSPLAGVSGAVKGELRDALSEQLGTAVFRSLYSWGNEANISWLTPERLSHYMTGRGRVGRLFDEIQERRAGQLMESVGIQGLTGVRALNVSTILGAYMPAFEEWAKLFPKGADHFHDLDLQIQQTTARFESLQKTLANLGVAPAEPQARGGPIFRRRGTDTVPAMLTPGEFVVNRKATQRYLPLLKRINAQYLQGGGSVLFQGLFPWETIGQEQEEPISLAEQRRRQRFHVLSPEELATATYQHYHMRYARRIPEFGGAAGRKSYYRRRAISGGAGTRLGIRGGAEHDIGPGTAPRRAVPLRPAGRGRRFEGYEKLIQSGVNPVEAFQQTFPTAWAAAEAVYGANQAGRFTPTRYSRYSGNFTSDELRAINAPIRYPRVLRNLMPARYWDQWMKLRSLVGEGRELRVSPLETRALRPRIGGDIRSAMIAAAALGQVGPDAIPLKPGIIIPDSKTEFRGFTRRGRGLKIRHFRGDATKTGVPIADVPMPPSRKFFGPGTAVPLPPSPTADDLRKAGVGRIETKTKKRERGYVTLNGKRVQVQSPEYYEEMAKIKGARPPKQTLPSLMLPDYIRNKPPAVRARLAKDYRASKRVEQDRLNKIMEYDRERDLAENAAKQKALQEFYRKKTTGKEETPTRAANAAYVEEVKAKKERARKRLREETTLGRDLRIAETKKRLRETERKKRAKQGIYETIDLDSPDIPVHMGSRAGQWQRATGWEFDPITKEWKPPKRRVASYPRISSYASGGLVSGYGDNVPAMLTPGEFVLSKGTVQALRKGGLVRHMQGGGTVTGGFDAEIFESAIGKFGDHMNTLNAAMESFNTSALLLQSAVDSLPEQFSLDTTAFNTSMVTFGTKTGDLISAIVGIPESIRVEIQAQNAAQAEEGVTATAPAPQLTLPGLDFSAYTAATEAFSGHVDNFSGSVEQFGSHVVSMTGAISAMGEAISALNQGFEITGQYTLNVNITGSEAFQEMRVDITDEMRELIGEQLEQFRRTLGDTGPGMI